MAEQKKEALIDKVRAVYPEVRSFKVTVFEYCRDDHPPSGREWSYSGNERAERGVFTELKHDKTTMLSGKFDMLAPVYSAAFRKVERAKGQLPPYYTDGSQTVTRSFECEVEYEKGEKPEGAEGEAGAVD